MNKLQNISNIDRSQEEKSQFKWLSVYIYYEGNLDIVLCKLIKPFLNEVLNKYIKHCFFIRYYENGSHIRLRLKGYLSTLDNSVWPILENMANDFFSNSIKQNKSAYLKIDPYIPEFDRYGGEIGIEIAE